MPAPIQSFPFDIGACKGPGGEQGLSAQREPWRKAAEKSAIADDLVGFAEVGDRRFFERHRRFVHWILRDPVNGVVRGLRNLLPDKLDKAFYLVEVTAGFWAVWSTDFWEEEVKPAQVRPITVVRPLSSAPKLVNIAEFVQFIEVFPAMGTSSEFGWSKFSTNLNRDESNGEQARKPAKRL